MEIFFMKSRIILAAAIAAGALASTSLPALAGTAPKTTSFKIVPLVANQTGKAPVVDPNLTNPWGMSQAPGGSSAIWVSDNQSGLSTLYKQGTGQIESLVVTIPQGNPTGTVYVPPGGGFPVTENGNTDDSQFLFASDTPGIISGWSPSVDANNAIIAVNEQAEGSQYKGLALDPKSELLFAANFTNNQVEIFNNQFVKTGSFTDTTLKGYGPFNVAIINSEVYVTFAKLGQGGNQVNGVGLGYVDIFSESGQLQTQLVKQGELDAPWGMTIAPSKFGTFANSLLVGNFGNGWIDAYNPTTGAFVGTLSTKQGKPVAISGLWGLDPVPTGEVTFTSGPDKQQDGLMGLIKAVK
jgi:uncharacterized protein (TIGR03118 family)